MPSDYLAYLEPNELEELLGGSGLDERSKLLQQQMAMAAALRNQPMPQHTSKAGTIWGGLGNALTGFSGALQEQRVLKEQKALAGEQKQFQRRGLELSVKGQKAELAAKAKAAQELYAQKQKDSAEETAAGNTEWGRRQVISDAAAKERAEIMAGQRSADRAESQAFRQQEAGVRADERGAKDLDKQVETLSKRMEGAPGLRNDITTLQSYATQKDIPGVGVWDGRMPDLLVSDDATRVRQSVKGILTSVLKEESGVAVSPIELKNKMKEFGFDDGATEDQFRLGLERLSKRAADLLKAKEAGARPEAVAEAKRRGLVTSEDIPLSSKPANGAPAPTGRTKKAKDGSVWMEMSDGSAVQVK